MKHLCWIVLSLFTLLACPEPVRGEPMPAPGSDRDATPAGAADAASDPGTPVVAAPEVPAEDLATLNRDNAAFAFGLYRALSGSQTGNLFLSPASISTALAMTYGGARGRTAEQMAQALRYSLPQERLHPAFGAQRAQLLGGDRPYELAVANRLWGHVGFQFREAYLALTRAGYGAELARVDFIGETEKTRVAINDWVEEQTRDKIVDLIPPGVLTGDTRLVLTNAIYFKGKWASQFDVAHTRKQAFTRHDGGEVDVDLMHQTAEFAYLEQPGSFQLLALPYLGDRLEMLVLLPTAADGLSALEARIDAASLEQWLAAARRQEVRVWLPRFRLEVALQLNQPMKDLGMVDAFDSAAADFSGMTGSPGLFVSDILHKAFVDVNEEGTEAAAATAVVMAIESEHPPPPEFRADHPFLFLIRDRSTGTILFMGRLTDPSA